MNESFRQRATSLVYMGIAIYGFILCVSIYEEISGDIKKRNPPLRLTVTLVHIRGKQGGPRWHHCYIVVPNNNHSSLLTYTLPVRRLVFIAKTHAQLNSHHGDVVALSECRNPQWCLWETRAAPRHTRSQFLPRVDGTARRLPACTAPARLPRAPAVAWSDGFLFFASFFR